MQRYINCQSGICRLQWRGKGSLSSWSLALRAGVLRRAVSHSARPMLRNATSSVTAGRSTCTNARTVPPKRSGNQNSNGSCLARIWLQAARAVQSNRKRIVNSNANGLLLTHVWLQAARAVRPNHSLNRTHCRVPPFGLKKPSPNASPPQRAG